MKMNRMKINRQTNVYIILLSLILLFSMLVSCGENTVSEITTAISEISQTEAESNTSEQTAAITSADTTPVINGIKDMLSAYPDGNIGKAYNCGTARNSDQTEAAGDESHLYVIQKTDLNSFNTFAQTLESNGYTRYFSREFDGNTAYGFTKDGKIYYAYFSELLETARIIDDTANVALLSELKQTAGNEKVEFYQYSIDYVRGDTYNTNDNAWMINCGMCYVIKLADNSLFIIDGGHKTQSSDDALESFDVFLHNICGKNIDEKLTINGWYFTHAHGDHVYFTYAFLTKFHEKYDLVNAFWNFPSFQTMGSGYDSGTFTMKLSINKYYPDATVYKLHTGQTFTLPGVDFEVIYTHEDNATFEGGTNISDFNASSTVLRIHIGGKTFMMLGDISTVAETAICSRYSNAFLKSDAVQLAHHCYNQVDAVYRAVSADLILVPNSKEGYQSNYSKVASAVSYAKTPQILTAGEFTYKIVVDGSDFTASKIARYTEQYAFTKPSDLSFNGLCVEETPVDTKFLNGTKELSEQIHVKSIVGTRGAQKSESPSYLFDSSSGSKWCVTNTTSCGVGFMTKSPVTVNGYRLYTAGDTATYPGRSPVSWTLYASVDGKNWVVLDTVYKCHLSTAAGAYSTFAIDNPGTYQYFYLQIHSVENGTTIQLADLRMYGTVQ